MPCSQVTIGLRIDVNPHFRARSFNRSLHLGRRSRYQHSGRNLSAAPPALPRRSCSARRLPLRRGPSRGWRSEPQTRRGRRGSHTGAPLSPPGRCLPGCRAVRVIPPRPAHWPPRARHGRIVAAQHGIEPDRRPSLDGDVADQGGCRGHKRGGIDPGRSALERKQRHRLDIRPSYICRGQTRCRCAHRRENCNVF